MNNKNTYLFDLGGVIFHLNFQKTYQAFEKLLGVNHQQFFDQFHQPVFFDQHERGEISDEQFLTQFKNINPALHDAAIIDAWNAMLVGIPEANIVFLEKLSQNANLYLLSNTNSIHWKKVHELMDIKQQRNRFYHCFKKVFLSFEVGMRKPEARIYQHCIKAIGIDPQLITFIDDNLVNIESATACGLKTRHYPPANPLLDEQF